jgi:hypothetical protein
VSVLSPILFLAGTGDRFKLLMFMLGSATAYNH